MVMPGEKEDATDEAQALNSHNGYLQFLLMSSEVQLAFSQPASQLSWCAFIAQGLHPWPFHADSPWS
jgi:hypothetical protein